MATMDEVVHWLAIECDDFDSSANPEMPYGFAKATTNEVAEGLGIPTDAAYRLLKRAQTKGLVTKFEEARVRYKGRGMVSQGVGWAIWEVVLTAEQRRAREAANPDMERLTPNHRDDHNHYVWVLPSRSDTPLSSEGPYGPMPLFQAEQMARIGATEGIHDRVVTAGEDPSSRSFQILKRYQARTGKKLVD